MISKIWTWITFNIPFMWELDGFLKKQMLKRLKRKYNKNKKRGYTTDKAQAYESFIFWVGVSPRLHYRYEGQQDGGMRVVDQYPLLN